MPDHVMNYIASDIPAELTVQQWRRSRPVPAQPRGLARLRTYVPLRRPRRLAI